MTRSRTVHESRADAATAAFHALGPSPSRHRVLAVHCARAHHLAGLYATAGGIVYVGVPWARSHGDRDRHDAAHHGGHRDRPWVDWLDGEGSAEVDDALPAGCECGKRTLSRAMLRHAVDSGEQRLVLD